MKMIKISMASTAIVSLSATLAFAQTAATDAMISATQGLFFDQGEESINEVILEQTVDGTDGINLNISGDMTSVVIKQSGTEATSSGNSARVNLFATTTETSLSTFVLPGIASESRITSGNRGANLWKTFSSTFDGDGNQLEFNLGTVDVTTIGYDEIDVDIAVIGDGNKVLNNSGSGLAGESFVMGGIITGNTNAVDTTIGSVGDVELNYYILGNSNTLVGTLAGAVGGTQDLKVDLIGNDNLWTFTANAAVGFIDVTATGNNITGTSTQNGSGSNLTVDINKSTDAAFAFTTTQSGAGNFADVTLNNITGGAFTLTQSSANASYTGILDIANGGAVTITQ
jgi:hypothetical protein